MKKIIEIEDVKFAYNAGSEILKGINLEVFQGEIMVLLGHNGAGKTTLMRLILDFIRGYSGKILINGKSSIDPESRANIGFMSEHPVIYDFEDARGYLNYYASLIDSISVEKERIDYLLGLTGLDVHKDKKLISYSKGMLQRLNLARSLLNDPELLIMDEPIIGLDPIGQELIANVAQERRKAGKSVLVNTHSVSFAEKLADRVGFLMGGELKVIMDRSEFMRNSFPMMIYFRAGDETDQKKLFDDFPEAKKQEDAIAVTISREENYKDCMLKSIEHGLKLVGISSAHSILEKKFLEYASVLKKEDRTR